MNRCFLILLLLVGAFWVSNASGAYYAKIRTTQGVITVRLYDQTPLHRDNFVRLARSGSFDGLLFHRVIPGFVVQGGDPDSRTAVRGALLGEGDLGYKIPAEIVPEYTHRKGVLAAAREGDNENPQRMSSASQFYITVADVHRLDGKYTVFGEVLAGQKVADKISLSARDKNDRPKSDIRIKKITIYERED